MFVKMSHSSENAAKNNTFVGNLYEEAVQLQKKKILDSLPIEWSNLHINGKIHIHDLEAYGKTYNCLSLNILNHFPFERFEGKRDADKIMGVIDYYKELIANIGNEQSGGIGFANFDYEINVIFRELHIQLTDDNKNILSSAIAQLLTWINLTKSRYGQECYYVTLNFGLDVSKIGRFISKCVLQSYMKSDFIIRPNIVFKVKKGVNLEKTDPNFDLLYLALSCTSQKMNPTFLICDTECNKKINPYELSIMGCRTRVVNNLFGKQTSVGRGNFANISINLPRIALEIVNSDIDKNSEMLVEEMKNKWLELAVISKKILINRLRETEKLSIQNFPANNEYQLWNTDFNITNGKINCFEQGTLSLGFIGLAEAFEILLDGKIFEEENNIYIKSLDFVSYMEKTIQNFSTKEKLNFSLLATSGEGISRRFPEIDEIIYPHEVQKKGYYTNSFHIEVNSNISVFEKLRLEGKYHKWCKGGSITYLELREVPVYNSESLYEVLRYACHEGINYLGINFPLDQCRKCKAVGIFNDCIKCGSKQITRVRRVSGYLEELTNFGLGKKNEEGNRTENVYKK